MREKFEAALDQYAAEGIAAFTALHPGEPRLSHVCFKFPDAPAFRKGVAEAGTLGALTHKSFGGKEIVWCRLHHPAVAGSLTLEWLELVEPEAGQAPHGVTAIGYAVTGLEKVIKIPSADGTVTFRFQGAHAAALAAS